MTVKEIIVDISAGNQQIKLPVANTASVLSVQIVGAGLNAAVTVQLRESNDRTNYTDIGGAMAMPAIGSSNNLIKVADLATAYQDVNITVGTATAGTLTLFCLLKK